MIDNLTPALHAASRSFSCEQQRRSELWYAVVHPKNNFRPLTLIAGPSNGSSLKGRRWVVERKEGEGLVGWNRKGHGTRDVRKMEKEGYSQAGQAYEHGEGNCGAVPRSCVVGPSSEEKSDVQR